MIIPVYNIVMGKREDIIAATGDLIVESGLQSLSFSKIFERAGVGSGTVYNYFPSKETLLNTLYRDAANLMDREVLAKYDQSTSLEKRFKTLLGNMARFVLAYRKELIVILSCSHSPYIAEELRTQITPSLQTALDIFAEGLASGELMPMDPMMAVTMVTGAITAVAQGALDGKYRLSEYSIDQAVDACWRAVLART